MDESIGLRIYAAGYITAGAILGMIGSFFGSIGSASVDLVASVLGFVACIGFFFLGSVVALKGIVVLIEEIVRAELGSIE